MTANTNLADLQAQIAELKAQKELQQLQAEVAAPEATPVVEAVAEPAPQTEFCAERFQKQQDIEAARVRGWGYFLGAYVTGPIWPAMVANRTGQWAPFWVGLGLGVATLPLGFMDLGILSSIPAAAAGTAMMSNKSQEKRAKLDITCAEQADMMRFGKL